MHYVALGTGQADVSQTRSSSLRTRVKPSELLSATAREKFLREFRLCRVLSQHLTAWRAASLSRGHRDALVIRCPTLPHLEDHSRPLTRQRAHRGLVILAAHALWSRERVRPPGVWDGL